jgi:competence protein ComEC
VGLAVLAAQLFLFKRRPGFPQLRLRLPNPDGFPASFIPIGLILTSLALGGLSFQSAQPKWGERFTGYYNDRGVPAEIEGLVVRPADARDRYTLLTIRVDQLQLGGETLRQELDGLALARVASGGDWRYGDRIAVSGELETPPEDEQFSYRDYLARQGVYSYLPNAGARLLAREQGSRLLGWIYSLRQRALVSLYRTFPDPEAALLAGILLGVEAQIPDPVTDAFRDSGTSHIIAISGFNMAIVAGLFAVLASRWLGRRRGALAALLAIVLYTLLVGAGASVVRAAIMAGLSLLAAQIGRRGNGLNTLAITAGLMALADPDVLWDVSFQLSFLATLGLVLYAGPLMDGFVRLAERKVSNETARRIAKPVGEYFLFTLAALLTTLPIMVFYFQRLPLLSPLANAMVLPVQPLLMILSGLAMLAGMVSPPIGGVLAALAWPLAAYTIRSAEFWARFQGAVLVTGEIRSLAAWAFYAGLLFVSFGQPRQRWQALRAWLAGVRARAGQPGWLQGLLAGAAPAGGKLLPYLLGGLALLTVLVWRAALSAPDGMLHVTLLDVGSGEAILIQTPGGRSLLVNGGSSPSLLSDGLGRRLPPGNRRLDFLIVAGIEDEQIGSLARVLERYPAGQVLWAGKSGGTRSARELEGYLAGEGIPVLPAASGRVIDLGQGAWLEVVSANQRGAALLVAWQDFRAWLPVSVDREALDALQSDPRLGSLSAVLLTDGGYAPLNPAGLLQTYQPQVFLLSVAPGDRRGLPDAEVIDALEGYTLLRTDQDGWIELATDGRQMWVTAGK